MVRLKYFKANEKFLDSFVDTEICPNGAQLAEILRIKDPGFQAKGE